MKKNNTIEDELDVTRIKFYESTKGMTTAETLENYSNLVAPICQKYGIKTIASASQRPMKIISDNSE
jgi:hypothetical protein